MVNPGLGTISTPTFPILLVADTLHEFTDCTDPNAANLR